MGKPSLPLPYLSEKDIERFWSKVDKESDSGCWLWLSKAKVWGYGVFQVRPRETGRLLRAHRISYFLSYGIDPGELCVLHKCDVRDCVRPDHLFLGTMRDNMADRDAKGRQAKGKRTGVYTHPESRATGDRSGYRKHPERFPRGERNHLSKLTDLQVKKIRANYTGKSGELQAFANEFGVSVSSVWRVAHKKAWKHI